MITCVRCGRVNDGRYRFCLGCGAALPQEKRSSGGPPSSVPSGSSPSGTRPTPDGLDLPQRRTPPGGAPPAPTPLHAAAPPSFSARVQNPPSEADESPTMALEPVAVTPTGTERPVDPNRVVARHTGIGAPQRDANLGPRGTSVRPGAGAAGPVASARSAGTACAKCSAQVPAGHVFCGVCGTPVAVAAPAPPTPEAFHEVGHLALIDDLGSESVRYPLRAGENHIGRSERCEIPFPQDGLLASKHCIIDTGATPFRLEPRDFCNGTYLRISTPVELHHGDIIRVGQEVLRFERIDDIEPELSGLSGRPQTVGCPMPRGVWGRLCQIGMARQVANAYLLSHRDVFLGRERGDILFPKDGFVSGSHAVISERGGRVYLKDLGSSNGTFLRVKQEIALRNGDLLLLGRNLLRVHVGA